MSAPVLTTVAEGVEDAPTWDLLGALGCDLAQGYFISRPMPAASVPNWARTQSAQFTRALTDAEGTGRLASIRGRSA